MMRALLLVLAALAAPAVALAAGPTQSLGADEVLRGRFVQERQLSGFKSPLRSEGHFVLAPSRGLIWDADKPFAVTTIITPDGLAQNIDGSQALRLDAAKVPFLSRLYDMLGGALSGDWRRMEADFTVTRTGNDKSWRVSMVPRTSDNVAMPFRSIEVTGGRFVDVIVMTRPDGDTDTLRLLDQSLARGDPTPGESAVFDSARR
ncbi:MAG: outer membrane lipoprotein carrier protein LolA [Gemmatimonas sp.]